MTDEEIRRIRRIVTGDLPVQPPRPVDPRHEERFRRALGSQRRASAPAPSMAVETPTAAPRVSEAPPSTTGARPSSSPSAKGGARSSQASPSARQSQAAATAAAHFAQSLAQSLARSLVRSLAGPAPAGEGESTSARAAAPEAGTEALAPPAVVVPPPMPVPAVTEVPAQEGWADDIADTVAALCQGSEPSFHSWTIQVPLDSEALPHTQLRMTFSRHHLLLRFSTESTRSFHLVSAHQSQLRALLVRALPGDRHIDIELT